MRTNTSDTGFTTQIIMPGIVEPLGLQVKQVSSPVPGTGQALVQMEATGVSYAEKAMRRGRYPGQPKFPFIPGYDVVGIIRAVGPDVDQSLVGTRVAAALKTGGWATELLIPAQKLVPVPVGIDPAEAETLIVNGITAWQMLYRKANAKTGQTILVNGVSSGVGIILAQLALHDGMRVIGTAAPRNQSALEAMGIEFVDYNAPNLEARIKELAPKGLDAAFDHRGIDSARIFFRLLARRGTLVSYGMASGLNDTFPLLPVFMKLIIQLSIWNTLPNTRRASFYDFWAGHLIQPNLSQQRLNDDLSKVLELLSKGAISGKVAARIPLVEASAAMELAESGTILGKVVIIP